MRANFFSILGALSILVASPGATQVTLDQLDSAMASESDALDAFRVRLQDPDPVKARAAMRLLIAKGDDAQRRLAIAHGFAATDPVMRLEAVRGILDTQPLLIFRLTTVQKKVSNNFRNALASFDGDFEDSNVVRVPVQIAEFSEENGCWTKAINGRCFARINSGELSLSFTGTWSQFVLNRDGQLVGNTKFANDRVDALADLTQ